MHSEYIFDAVESHHSECKYGARIRWIKCCLIQHAKARVLFLKLNNLKYIL